VVTARESGPLYLSAADVERAMPDVAERLSLARRAMVALVADAEMPPKVAVHPRSTDSFAHAMPAFVRGAARDGSGDLLGIKWVTGFPANTAAGIPGIHATVLVNEPTTGRPGAILDGGPITAHRTAAVSGVAIETWKPDDEPATLTVVLIGAGVQARSHLAVLGHLLPGARLVITDRHPDRAERVAADARATGWFSGASVDTERERAVAGADVVISLVSFGPHRQGVPARSFANVRLIVAVDYDMCVPADVAERATPFVVDERAQFEANRSDAFAGYPEPATTIGEALVSGDHRPAPRGGSVLVTHLGVGVADLVFADAILASAARQGLGTRLPGAET
jgi:ornithine cyclodeaminase